MPLPNRNQAQVLCAGEAQEKAPRCPGVYRFFSNEDVLLYVGKSIDIRTRLNSHFTDAKQPGRHQQLMGSVRRVECELTAGETGALLIENAAIKGEAPLYNRRQRRSRKLWTQRLQQDNHGFLQVIASDFCPSGRRNESVFGLFRSRHHLEERLRSIAREQRLCLRVLGYDRGRGPCFQHQLARCAGACAGAETAQAHNERLLASLESQRIAAWPFPGPVLLEEERRERLHEQQPKRQFHVLDNWSYLGTFNRRDQALHTARADKALSFDRDSYRIAFRAFRDDACAVLDGATGESLHNPFGPLTKP
ncbi:MAG: GIY-YIG nuclease family protein [Pseudomonadota bacterium]